MYNGLKCDNSILHIHFILINVTFYPQLLISSLSQQSQATQAGMSSVVSDLFLLFHRIPLMGFAFG